MRINKKATLTPATPLSFATLLGVTGVAAYADRVFVQMAKGGTGVGYVLDLSALPAGTTPDKTQSNQVAAQLLPADANDPGGSYSDSASIDAGGSGIDLNQMYVDGDNADPIIVSVNRRV